MRPAALVGLALALARAALAARDSLELESGGGTTAAPGSGAGLEDGQGSIAHLADQLLGDDKGIRTDAAMELSWRSVTLQKPTGPPVEDGDALAANPFTAEIVGKMGEAIESAVSKQDFADADWMKAVLAALSKLGRGAAPAVQGLAAALEHPKGDSELYLDAASALHQLEPNTLDQVKDKLLLQLSQGAVSCLAKLYALSLLSKLHDSLKLDQAIQNSMKNMASAEPEECVGGKEALQELLNHIEEIAESDSKDLDKFTSSIARVDAGAVSVAGTLKNLVATFNQEQPPAAKPTPHS
mmetsp:Transcript_8429/g.24765  ORF Transcript_8429/g.24765 Transcript_8429/m.24765 type:complete len:298 (-) Transcript_8429:57-950(-)